MTKLRTINELEKLTRSELRELKETYLRLLSSSQPWSFDRAQILATLQNIESVLAARRHIVSRLPG